MASPELAWAIETIRNDRANAGVRDTHYDVHAARASVRPLDLPEPDGVVHEWIDIGALRAVWVTTPESDAARRMLCLHGGGYFSCSFETHRTLCAWIAQLCGVSVLFPEYRLAPEHKFPAAVDDAQAAYEHLLAHGPRGALGAASQVLVAGDSAGGGLAVSTLLRARRDRLAMPHGAILLCAMLDLDEHSSSFLQLTQRARDMVRHYVSWLPDLRHPEASQVLCDPSGFPPLLIQTGSADYCRDDNLRFAQRARAAGVDVTLQDWPDMIHVWQRFVPRLPEATQALADMAGWIEARRH